jgi:ACS family tartrate transporter-like MFS transporter
MAAVQPVFPVPLSPSVDNAVGISALRKGSWRLLPLIGLGYGAAIIDRVNISFASLQMNRDLHFSASTYGFGAGLFFLGCASFEIGSNLMICRFGARRWMAHILLSWGLIAIGMMFVRTPTQFYVMRFMLGAAEAGFFPGIVFYLAQWFPEVMRARAMSRFYIAVPLSSVVMGAFAGVLLNLQGKLGLAGWQWLFLIEGLPPVLLSFAYFVYLPNHPGEAKWLTVEERSWLENQLQQNAPTKSHPNNVSNALLDPHVWLLSLLLFCMLTCSYAYTFSAPTILRQATSLSVTRVGFLIAIMSLLGAIVRHSDRRKERYWHVAMPLLLAAGGYIVGGFSATPFWIVTALTVSYLSMSFLPGAFWAIPPSFLKGRSGAAGIATVSTLGILGGFLGPYWMGFMKDLTGDYHHALMTLALPSLAAAFLMFIIRRRLIYRGDPIVEQM